jgi:hypothetical protein
MRRFGLAAVLLFGCQLASGDDIGSVMPSPGSPAVPGFGPPPGAPAAAPAQPPSPYASTWPAPGQPALDARPNDPIPPSLMASPDHLANSPVVTTPVSMASPVQSTWYYRLDSFSWSERVGGYDVVNENGPISTLGYVRRNGIDRFRAELFGGTVAYDGSAQYPGDDGFWHSDPYHQSFGTNYLGCRGEYELLPEALSWGRAQVFLGVGTRFWLRDLRNAVTPSNMLVSGYQETWWTFYPYIGIETKDSDEQGLQFFGSMRFGVTPLTYQYASYYDTVAWPKCGVTAQAEAGVRYQRLSLSAFIEVMTWAASATVDSYDAFGNLTSTFQPDSRMLTVGGKIGYTF